MFGVDINRKDNWHAGQEQLCSITKKGDIYTFHNVRDMDHHTQSVAYREESYDIQTLESVDFIFVPFGNKGVHKIFAHIMLQFHFSDGRHLVLSIEARRKKGESYNRLHGLFRRYGVIYIRGEESDLISLRRDVWKSNVYRYRLNFIQQETQDAFLFYIDETNKLFQQGKYYNTLLYNCVNNLYWGFPQRNERLPRQTPYSILATHTDRYLFDLGYIDGDDFATTRKKAHLKPLQKKQ